MEEKEIQTCVDGAVKTYFDKFAERVTQESEYWKNARKHVLTPQGQSSERNLPGTFVPSRDIF